MKKVNQRAKAIKLLILDVDGVLTDGRLYYISEQIDARAFHIHDGLGIKLLQQTGIPVAIISAKKSPAVLRRLKELKIKDYYLGNEQKLEAYDQLKDKYQLEDTHIAYVGDDLPDLPILKRVGFAITVPNAPAIIQEHVHYITKIKAGRGAVREVVELILQAQGKYDSVLESYLAQ